MKKFIAAYINDPTHAVEFEAEDFAAAVEVAEEHKLTGLKEVLKSFTVPESMSVDDAITIAKVQLDKDFGDEVVH